MNTDAALSNKIGISVPGIQIWKARPTVTPRQVAELSGKCYNAAAKDVQVTTIRPVVEFFRLAKCDSVQGRKLELFRVREPGHTDHPYLAGIKSELQQAKGIYIFFDSRGQAIYAGKAKRQPLWNEMTSAFNRDRGSIQLIRRVRHPTNRVQYRTSDEKSRQINPHFVPLHELAAYVSAYRVLDGMIDELEALLVRSFANDLLNKRMERFGHVKKDW